MLIILLKIYSVVFLSVVVHELTHALVARLLRKEVNEICIGNNLLSLHFKKICISPICINNYIDINESEIIKMSKKELIFFFFSGLFSNLLLLFTALFIKDLIISYTLFIFNLFLIIENLNPLSTRNDLKMFCYYIKLATHNNK